MAFPESERPDISIVAGDATSSGPAAPRAAQEPEAQPPVVIPPEDPEPTIGGQVAEPPSPEAKIAAAGGGLADRLRARFQAMDSTEEFAIPGWDLPNGDPGLILVAKTFGDRQGYNKGLSNEAFIAKSTHKLLYVNDDGTREEIPGGWGPQLAEMIGVRAQKAADLIAYVISKPHPEHPDQRIPNVAGIGALATDIIAWAGKARREAEEDLGE